MPHTQSLSTQALVTEAEFLALPESTRRVELIDGGVVMPPSPSFWHQEVLGRLVSTLRSWAKGRDVTVVQAPLDVRFGPDRILQPDAMVFLSALDREVSTPIDSIPELCVEVLSTHRAYDRVTKRFIYAEAGVQEYWIVDAGRGVERRDGPGLARIEVVTNELTTPLLPDLVVDVPALLGG